VPIVHFTTVRFASIPSINQYNKFQHHKDNHKNQQDKKPFHINTITTLFAPSPSRKNQNPNKLNHLLQLQGRQQNSPSAITRVD
jgi:glycyl-tRNA synthetase alpha subunit